MCLTPVRLKSGDDVPCGKCAHCIQTKRTHWAVRVYNECITCELGFFITLTYSNEFLTWVDDVPVLQYDDVKKFFKKVRKEGYNFRYFLVGEYGEKSGRPHYHLILVTDNVKFDVYKFCEKWNLGFSHIGLISMASIMYVLKDMLKEVDMFKDVPRAFKPHILVSNGFGAKYIEKLKYWHKRHPVERNYVILNGFKVSMPRYFKDKIYSKFDRRLLEVARDNIRQSDLFLYPATNTKKVKEARLKERNKTKIFEEKRKKQLKIKHFNKSL